MPVEVISAETSIDSKYQDNGQYQTNNNKISFNLKSKVFIYWESTTSKHLKLICKKKYISHSIYLYLKTEQFNNNIINKDYR